MSRVKKFDLNPLQMTMVSVSAEDNNCYILYSPQAGAQIVVDAADNFSLIQQHLHSDVPVVAVITTHSHWDHHRATAELIAATGAKHFAGAGDAPDIPVPTDELLHDGQQLQLLGQNFLVRELRGHTPGSIAMVFEGARGSGTHIITGDALFPGGVGNTQGDPDRFASLLRDVTERIFEPYGDDTVFYPGHGELSTLGEQRPHLDAWRERGW